MADFELMKELAVPTDSKIVMLVVDGLGGLPGPDGGSELEVARIPNLDRLARESLTGLIQHVGPGITPGSGPGHLALFGYDPVKYLIGRGTLEAVGIDFDLKDGDLAARGNFCTVDSEGVLTDRRAGRPSQEVNEELCRLLSTVKVPGVEVLVRPVREHRFVVVFRGAGLEEGLNDTDPQREGLKPYPVEAQRPEARRSAEVANAFIEGARQAMSGRSFANMVMLRGFSRRPEMPRFPEVYNLRAAAIAVYPMYRGLTSLVGMDVLPAPKDYAGEIAQLRDRYRDYEFFYVHYKKADSAGEDGNFAAKVAALEEFDSYIPEVLDALDPDVLIVTGDHATPAILKAHSWHPVPVALKSRGIRGDEVTEFSERAFRNGDLGRFPADQLMPIAMANALKLQKFGA